MRIDVVRTDCTEHATPLLALKVFEDEPRFDGPVEKVDRAVGGLLRRIVDAGDFKGKEGQTLLLYPEAGTIPATRMLLVGIGKRERLDAERIRRAAATAAKSARRLGVDRFSTMMHHAEAVSDRVSVADAARAVAEGILLASYTFDEWKSKKGDDEETPLGAVEILEKVGDKAREIERGVKIGAALARGENLVRTLGNLPGNVATPTYLAERAEEIASRLGMTAEILGPAEMRELGMGALLGVAQGTDQEPRLILLHHRRGPADARPLVLIGKGLTFDAGGISIKPAQGMEEMKFDMCGGAAVLGAMQAIGELEAPLNVIGVVPASENLLSGSAMKPGDILRSMDGKTIEVINTDAEGRLILADAITYARKFDPAAMVDVATLTGACVVALGNQACGLFGNDSALIDELRRAGERVHERAWPMPMFDEYREQIRSDYADIKNSGGRPAGSITAAWFLREFAGEVPWAHLDIAGVAYGDGKLPYQVKGSTGAPTRLLVEWVLSRAG